MASVKEMRMSRLRRILRLVGAMTSGMIAGGAWLSGGDYTLSEVYGWHGWTMGGANGHGIIRGISSVIGTAICGYIAGLVARRRGGIVAAVLSIPFCAFWTELALKIFRNAFPG